MQSQLILSVGLPAALCIIMLGLGLSLRLEDFTAVLAKPRAVMTGVAIHALLLPPICLLLVYISDLPYTASVGMMLLAASPGAVSAALFTHFARGDVALSLTLAVATSLLALVLLPVAAGLSLYLFQGAAETVLVDVSHVLQIFGLAVVPVLIGIFVRGRYPAVAAALDRPVKLLAAIFLIVVVLLALIGNWRMVIDWGPSVGTLALVFNLICFALGYYAPRLLGVAERQAIAIAMEVGIRNAALAITMALSEYMLDNADMAIPPALYGLVAYITGGLLLVILKRVRPSAEVSA